jgi:hypothetical protein
MTSTKSNGGKTRVDGIPVVVVVCYTEVASVFGAVAVRMSDERAFPLLNESVSILYNTPRYP